MGAPNAKGEDCSLLGPFLVRAKHKQCGLVGGEREGGGHSTVKEGPEWGLRGTGQASKEKFKQGFTPDSSNPGLHLRQLHSVWEEPSPGLSLLP